MIVKQMGLHRDADRNARCQQEFSGVILVREGI
jgi:hypothetical protein